MDRKKVELFKIKLKENYDTCLNLTYFVYI